MELTTEVQSQLQQEFRQLFGYIVPYHVKLSDFPVVRVGTRILISVDEFNKWLSSTTLLQH